MRPRKRARRQCGDGHVGNQLVWLLRPLPEGWRALLEPGSRVRMAARGLRVVALLTGDVPLDDDGLVSSRKIHRGRGPCGDDSRGVDGCLAEIKWVGGAERRGRGRPIPLAVDGKSRAFT